MKIKLEKITELNNQFTVLGNARLKASKALEVFKFKKKLEEIAGFVETKRLEICNTYGELIENGAKYSFKNEDVPKVNEEYESLMNLEEEFPDFTISISELDLDNLQVTPHFFQVMEGLIVT